MKPKILLTNLLPDSVMERLAAETLLTAPADSAPFRYEDLLLSLPGHDALFGTITDRVDAPLLESAASKGLRVVGNFGVGFNHIDIAAATRLGIQVTNTPGVLTAATADIAFGLMLSAARRFSEGEALVRAGQWKGWAPLQLLGQDVSGSTLGLIGFGRIGKAMAARARGFDMKLIYWNRTRLSPDEEKECGATYATREEVFAQADFLSLHVAYAPETHHLVDAAAFSRMKPTAVLINTARGPVVDESALVDALRAGRIAAAGLDVFEREPALTAGLAELPNCTLLPHLGSATVGTRARMGHIVLDDILAVLDGRRPAHPVN
jgi:glyoxylate reductase